VDFPIDESDYTKAKIHGTLPRQVESSFIFEAALVVEHFFEVSVFESELGRNLLGL
jgi:hypothetical protein